MDSPVNFAALAQAMPTGERQAALLLHGLAPKDREWVLGRLTSQQQADLHVLLVELEALAIPAQLSSGFRASREGKSSAQVSTSLGDDAMGQRPGDSQKPPSERSDEQYLMSLSPAQVQLLARRLRFEPAPLIARSLQLRPWPWRAALLQQLSETVRRKVQDSFELCPPGSATTPYLDSALMRLLRERISKVDTDPGHAEPAGAVTAGPRSRWPRPGASWAKGRRG